MLDSFPRKLGYRKGTLVSWLMACIYYKLKEYDSVNKFLSIFYNYKTNLDEKGLQTELFNIWKNGYSSRNAMSLYFPVLLPMLSNREELISSKNENDLLNTKETSSPSAQEIIQQKEKESDFDVFLCHNSQNKRIIKCIGNQLRGFGLLPWLDEWEIIPGRPWQEALEEQIKNIKSVAIFIGPEGIGPWQHSEVNAFLRKFHRERIPIIPVILPSCQRTPVLPIFLESFHWIDFRKESPNPYDLLVWGITGIKTDNLRSTLLESPINKVSNESLIEDIKKVIQEEMDMLRNEVLTKVDEETSKIVSKLNETQLSTTRIIVKSIEESKMDNNDMENLLNGIKELQSNPPNNPEIAKALEKIPPIMDDAKLGIDHKLKWVIPLIPVILSYQGEYKLSSGLNLSSLIYKISEKVYSKFK